MEKLFKIKRCHFYHIKCMTSLHFMETTIFFLKYHHKSGKTCFGLLSLSLFLKRSLLLLSSEKKQNSPLYKTTIHLLSTKLRKH